MRPKLYVSSNPDTSDSVNTDTSDYDENNLVEIGEVKDESWSPIIFGIIIIN